ncbi:hypothetical protein AB1Y20_015281 [Prymnesium parvum]|uniref:Mitochondrial cytochrome c oxidase subunit VIa n=1 Tax=Prymnesium parvum TaxID=97485 RepID=A0AB34JWB2_PRYPA
MNSLLRRSPLIRAQLRAARNMSGHSIEHAQAEAKKWKNISYVALPFICVVGVWVGYDHVTHHDHWEQVQYPYIGKRDKPMPWTLAGGSECALFDYKCARKLEEAKKALA